jgi:hypothetical protein
MRKYKVLKREITSSEEDNISKGETTSCEGGRYFIDDGNLHDKQISLM